MRPLTIVNIKLSRISMTSYNSFIGIDIGKFNFVVNEHGSKQINEYEHTSAGISDFLNKYETALPNGLCILETTGGYEMELLLTLCNMKFAVHRANTRKVKHFIRSYGNDAKTDALDAKALASYGHERHNGLKTYESASATAMELYELVMRRQDLKQMLVSEKNRLKGPRAKLIKSSVQSVIDVLNAEVVAIDEAIESRIKADNALQTKRDILKTVPGIGNIIANYLLVLVPELGQLSRREIASLVGVAPKSNDSGKFSGYRATTYGRAGVKPNLFLAAMAARNSNSSLKGFYEQLIARGKKKKVALTALMRKIIIIANARVKELELKGVQLDCSG